MSHPLRTHPLEPQPMFISVLSTIHLAQDILLLDMFLNAFYY